VSYVDKTLNCRECGQGFTFTAGEQEFYASHGLMNEPSRCPDCRSQRRAQQSGGGYGGGYRSSGGGGGGYGREREMFSATCSNCGKEALVPFQPRTDRPVYCSDCFQQVRGERPSYR
jgi:CxxC-x17-CxxC domain-containing protein